ncbi:AH receptor-interacting protein [Chrysoperla carnea]|uniref:AH receptor-interacting protein n=1 Tax=Chrysoperla carnea TaxID=189513 RepID=UPI001D063182|nr:AH receptor-interacting protein [Chrysoperla carnea]
MSSKSKNDLIVKKIIHLGTKNVDFEFGTKVTFHFQTRLCNDDRTLIDDSRALGDKPMELVIGKKFKLEVWEAIVQKMALNEVAQFTVDKSLVSQYPFVSKVLRNAVKPNEKHRAHCCVATLQNEGVGYDDLNNLLKKPCDLEFTIELLKVESPNDYKKELWQLSDDEKLKMIPVIRERGNIEFHEKNYAAAAETYGEAIGLLEQLMLKEKPHDDEWNELNKMKIPLLLNYSQCKLNLSDFYPVIEHCTTVLQSEPDNIKALFRRGRAHVGAWNPEKAKEDFRKVIGLDPTLIPAVQKEMKVLTDTMKLRDEQDKKNLRKLF